VVIGLAKSRYTAQCFGKKVIDFCTAYSSASTNSIFLRIVARLCLACAFETHTANHTAQSISNTNSTSSRTTINRQQRIIHIRTRPLRRLPARRCDVDILDADIAAFLFELLS
jgi:hypothetical protein